MDAPITLRAWADYVCPWCYVGQVNPQRFHEEYGIAVDWQPFLLRPDAPKEGWALPENIKARINSPDNPLAVRAKAVGLELHHREWIPNSRRALAANEWVRQTAGLEKLHAFHSAVGDHYWAKSEDISTWDVLMAAAADVGLDGKAMRDAVDNGTFEAQIDESIARANEMGIHAVPTYVFFRGDEPVGAIQGAQEYEVFQRAAKQLGLAPKQG